MELREREGKRKREGERNWILLTFLGHPNQSLLKSTTRIFFSEKINSLYFCLFFIYQLRWNWVIHILNRYCRVSKIWFIFWNLIRKYKLPTKTQRNVNKLLTFQIRLLTDFYSLIKIFHLNKILVKLCNIW